MQKATKILVWFCFLLLFTNSKGYGKGIGTEGIASTNSVVDINVLGTANYMHLCYDDRDQGQISIEIENLGSDTLTSVELGWFLAYDETGTFTWSGVLPPGVSIVIPVTNIIFSTGTHNVSVWASSGVQDVDVSNDTTIIDVTVDPPFVLDALSDTTVCANENVSIAVPSGYPSYQWSTGAISSSILAESSGNYSVTVTDASGCEASDSMIVQAFASPSALLPDDTVLCDGQIFVPVVSGRFLSYTWDLGDTVSNISISVEGDYVLSVMDSSGCSYTDTLNVQFAAPPVPSVPTLISICDGDSATISVAANYSSYQWSTGATGTSISTNTSGVYYVTVTGTTGCLGFDTVQVLVNPLPVVEFSDSTMCNLEPFVLDVGWFSGFLWSTGDTVQNPIITSPGTYSVSVTDQNGCVGVDSIEIINTNVSVFLGHDTAICAGDHSFIILDRYESYLWDDGNNGATRYISDPGTYSVTVSDDGCFTSDEIEVTEIPIPNADFTEYMVSPPSVEFTNMSNLTTNLNWDFGDGNTSSLENPIHVYAINGLYQVTLTVSNVCDTSVYQKNVAVFPLAGNNMDVNKAFKLYPTIAGDMVNLKIGNTNYESFEYSIYDVVGKLILVSGVQNPSVNEEYKIDISNLAVGSYYLRVISNSELVGVSQFLKR